jgi:alpha-L-fucosidase 2
LPQAWASGSVKGLRARGGFVVGITWKDGRWVSATIESLSGSSCRVRAPAPVTVQMASGKGKAPKVASLEPTVAEFPTKAGTTYLLTPAQ